MEIWPIHVIEEALGDNADGLLPQAIRCAELRVRLPRHHIDMLEHRAEQRETTVSGELDGIVTAHIEELSAAFFRVRRGDGVGGVRRRGAPWYELASCGVVTLTLR